MGSYLSQPIIDKDYTTGRNDFLSFISCSMQGWRTTQEDSLNCIIDFAENISLFAVYDGHGGKEVSQLCSQRFPEVLKNCKHFIRGHYADALKESYLEFDQSLLSAEIQSSLQKLSKNIDNDNFDDLNLLQEEATMPLSKLLINYDITDYVKEDNKNNQTTSIREIFFDDESDEEYSIDEDSDTDDSDYVSSEDEACKNTDDYIQTMQDIDSVPGFTSGSTSLVTLIDRKKSKIYVANAGDSRCVLCRNGRAMDLSVDHKPLDTKERKRIIRAGGVLGADGRINGGLNLSRSIGDHSYKKNKSLDLKDQIISPMPDVVAIDLKPDIDEFLVLACDGIWDTFSSKELIEFIKRKMTTVDMRDIITQIFNHCLAPVTGSSGSGRDNMTCIIVTLAGSSGPSAVASATKRNVDPPLTTDGGALPSKITRVNPQ